MASAPGAAVSVPIKIKFIFANHDGVVVEYTAEPGTLVKDLKTELADQWPSGAGLPFPPIWPGFCRRLALFVHSNFPFFIEHTCLELTT